MGGSKFFTFHFSLLLFFTTFAGAKRKMSACRDGGMVDTRDLKSLGHSGCAGSSPARGTKRSSLMRTFLLFIANKT